MVGSVLQNGYVTPGHYATWVTDGVLQDGGPVPASYAVLGSIFGANFGTTADQPILIPPAITAFQLTGIIVTNASTSLTQAEGGFYPAASKGGTAIVASSQVYSALTSPNLLMQPTISAFGQAARFSSANLPQLLNSNGQYCLAIYLSLSTAQSTLGTVTADVYLLGVDLSPP
jgi:hypothetical protein